MRHPERRREGPAPCQASLLREPRTSVHVCPECGAFTPHQGSCDPRKMLSLPKGRAGGLSLAVRDSLL